MVKHAQTIPQLLLTNYLGGFDHLMELALKRLTIMSQPPEVYSEPSQHQT